MNDKHEDRLTVYEVGYLIGSNIPVEKVPEEADKVKAIITKSGASIVAEGLPHEQDLAYTIRVKQVSGAYEKFDRAYFGWIKFELGSSQVEAVKKKIEIVPSVLRTLLITTVKENTFLGRRAPAMAGAAVKQPLTEGATVAKTDVAPATIEEMDKSIDDMVKEVN